MTIKRSIFTLVCASLSLGAALNVLAQEAHPFGGITLMRVDNPDVLDAVKGVNRGQSKRPNEFLLTVVAGNQSYASAPNAELAANARVGGTGCWTWITAGPDASGQTVLGNGQNWRYRDETRQLKDKYMCAEFSLRRQSAKQVAFSSNGVRATLPIVESYPIVPVDWTDPSISEFRFYGAGLGSITLQQFAEMTNRSSPQPLSRAQIVDELRRQSRTSEKYAGTLSRLAARWETDDGNAKIDFSGLIDTERLISSGQAEIPYARYLVGQRKPLQKALFREALIDRYGPPTAHIGDPTGTQWFTLFWIHDLQGRLVTEEAGINNPGVQSIVKYGLSKNYPSNNTDIGPWGFGVVMSVVVSGYTDVVNNYEVHMQHGHALAHQHFSDRLNMISHIQKTTKEEEQFTPSF